MTKEQFREYINEAVDAMEQGELESLFPPDQQPDLYSVIQEMTGLRGEVRRLSQSSLQLNNQLKTSAEEQKQEWETMVGSLKTSEGAITTPIISEEETKTLILKLVEQDDNIHRMSKEFGKIDVPTFWTLNAFKQKLAAWSKGFEINQKQWQTFFKQTGIYKTGKEGEQFDPQYHEAIATKQDISKNENTILETELVGIIFKNKLIRRAKVIVNK